MLTAMSLPKCRFKSNVPNPLSAGQPDAGSPALFEHLAAESKLLGRSPAGVQFELARPLDQPAPVHQPAEVLLVELKTRQGLHDPLPQQKVCSRIVLAGIS